MGLQSRQDVLRSTISLMGYSNIPSHAASTLGLILTLPLLPKIIEFLGYCPFDLDWTPGEWLAWIRKYSGLSQEAMARRLAESARCSTSPRPPGARATRPARSQPAPSPRPSPPPTAQTQSPRTPEPAHRRVGRCGRAAAPKCASGTRQPSAASSGRRAGGPRGSRTDRTALPFCGFQIKAKRPTNTKYCKNPITIGDHLRKRRLVLKLGQPRVANLLGTGADTVYLWENNRVKPTFRFLPKIIEFLGYCPVDLNDTPGRRLAWARRCIGLSQSAMARAIGIDPATLAKLERGWWLKRERFLRQATDFLASRVAAGLENSG